MIVGGQRKSGGRVEYTVTWQGYSGERSPAWVADPAEFLHLNGGELTGRKIAVKFAGVGWETGQITKYDPQLKMHIIRFDADDSSDGSFDLLKAMKQWKLV